MKNYKQSKRIRDYEFVKRSILIRDYEFVKRSIENPDNKEIHMDALFRLYLMFDTKYHYEGHEYSNDLHKRINELRVKIIDEKNE